MCIIVALWVSQIVNQIVYLFLSNPNQQAYARGSKRTHLHGICQYSSEQWETTFSSSVWRNFSVILDKIIRTIIPYLTKWIALKQVRVGKKWVKMIRVILSVTKKQYVFRQNFKSNYLQYCGTLRIQYGGKAHPRDSKHFYTLSKTLYFLKMFYQVP